MSSRKSAFMSPEDHSIYWRDLAQARLAKLSRARHALRECARLATAKGHPPGSPGHFGIKAVARAALKEIR